MPKIRKFEAVTFDGGNTWRAIVRGTLQQPEFPTSQKAITFALDVYYGVREARIANSLLAPEVAAALPAWTKTLVPAQRKSMRDYGKRIALERVTREQVRIAQGLRALPIDLRTDDTIAALCRTTGGGRDNIFAPVMPRDDRNEI